MSTQTILASKIFLVQQIRACDAFTIIHEPIASELLMERAATACFDWLKQEISKEQSMVVVCGAGNNGGDGLVITRLLLDHGFQAKAILIQSDKYSKDH